jgi:hypothetical protein
MARSAKTQWIDQSIVARRGVNWAKKPVLHNLTEAVQGKFHYKIGPYSDPGLTVAPGDRIGIETRDAFEGAIRTERDKPTKRLRMPFVNLRNGPTWCCRCCRFSARGICYGRRIIRIPTTCGRTREHRRSYAA